MTCPRASLRQGCTRASGQMKECLAIHVPADCRLVPDFVSPKTVIFNATICSLHYDDLKGLGIQADGRLPQILRTDARDMEILHVIWHGYLLLSLEAQIPSALARLAYDGRETWRSSFSYVV